MGTEKTTTVTFATTPKTKSMFELALLLSQRDRDDVFEEFVESFAKKTLNQSVYKTPNPLPTIKKDSLFYLEKQSPATDDFSDAKAARRIPLWANRKSQFNHQIIRAFFLCEKDEIAHKSEMREIFLQNVSGATEWQFDNNLNSMLTDEGNAHGHVFDCNGDIVSVAKDVKNILYSFRNNFLQ